MDLEHPSSVRSSINKHVFELIPILYLFCCRAQVNELWAKGEKVTCGVVSEDTRVSCLPFLIASCYSFLSP